MVRRINVLVIGVGGQGLITMSRLLAEAALAKGMDVSAAETHGMSQRGGSVVVFVRIGDRVLSPTFSEGQANYILSTELVETVRNLVYASRDTTIVTNTKVIYPALPNVKPVDPSKLLELVKSRVSRVIDVPASQIAEEVGNPHATNMVILGVASVLLRDYLDTSYLEKAVSRIGKGKVAEANLAAYKRGVEIGTRALGS
ncbi:MAG: indolepyruvate oxidoreductase subunit beta [Crenarchaeota archaeon]|nr:indolepyruvate oxidoreductase subunit beta [Thermoproteota archaeon]